MQRKIAISITLIMIVSLLLVGCGVQRDELVTMQADLDELKSQVEYLTQEVEKTPAPTPTPEPTPEQKTEWTFEKDNCSAKLSKGTDHWVAEITDPNLKDEYSVNNLEIFYMEYSWMVCFAANDVDYQVGTSYCKFTEEGMKNLPVQEMQSDLWKVSGSSMSSEGTVTVEKDGNTLVWTFDLPNDIDLSTVKITGIEIITGGNYQ